MANSSDLIRYQKAGYRYLLVYEVWLVIAHEWKVTKVPSTTDDLDAHIHAVQIRSHYGETRHLTITRLDTGEECPALVPQGLQPSVQPSVRHTERTPE